MAIFNIIVKPYEEELIDFRSSTLMVRSSNTNIKSSELQIDPNNI